MRLSLFTSFWVHSREFACFSTWIRLVTAFTWWIFPISFHDVNSITQYYINFIYMVLPFFCLQKRREKKVIRYAGLAIESWWFLKVGFKFIMRSSLSTKNSFISKFNFYPIKLHEGLTQWIYLLPSDNTFCWF